MQNEQPLVLQKNADKARNKIIIPKFFIDKCGNQFYMKIYNDLIILEPINKKRKVVNNDGKRIIG